MRKWEKICFIRNKRPAAMCRFRKRRRIKKSAGVNILSNQGTAVFCPPD